MKITLLLLVAACACQSVQAQTKLKLPTSSKDSALKITVSPFTGIGYFDKNAEVTVWDNGTIEIKGDSIRAIKMLWDKLREANKREMRLEQTLSKLQELIDKLKKSVDNN